MKTVDKTFDDEKYMNDEVVEAVEKAKDAFEGAAKTGDAIELNAGWKTVFVWLWANLFYAHRQKKWIRLLKCRKS